MSSLSYSSLSKSQRAQVAYLFADAIFGTDASGFVYEVDGEEIRGRRAIDPQKNQVRARRVDLTTPKVTMLQEVHITDEMTIRSMSAMNALAASVANHIHSLKEVHA